MISSINTITRVQPQGPSRVSWFVTEMTELCSTEMFSDSSSDATANIMLQGAALTLVPGTNVHLKTSTDGNNNKVSTFSP